MFRDDDDGAAAENQLGGGRRAVTRGRQYFFIITPPEFCIQLFILGVLCLVLNCAVVFSLVLYLIVNATFVIYQYKDGTSKCAPRSHATIGYIYVGVEGLIRSKQTRDLGSHVG